MSKQKIDIGQPDNFGVIEELSRKQAKASSSPANQGKASIDAAIRAMITDALKKTHLSRYEVAARMSNILGVEITKSQIDSWSAESKENHRFPFVYAGAFCEATIDKSLCRFMAQLCGGYYIEGEDALLLQLCRIQEAKRCLENREKSIRDLLRSARGDAHEQV